MFKELEAKLSYIVQHTSTNLRMAFEQTLLKTIAESDGCHGTLPVAQQKMLYLDLLYCFVKHRTWHGVALFVDVVAEFLANDYGLSRPFSERLLASLLPICATDQWPQLRAAHNGPATVDESLASTQDPVHTDREFLRYIFIASATAPNEKTLLIELGLGKAVLNRLKSTAENVVSVAQDKSRTLEFIPDVDQLLRDIMLELAEDLKVTPWLMDLYRLQYLLADLPAISQGGSLEVQKPFQLLLNIGRSNGASLRQIAKWTAKFWSDLEDKTESEHLLKTQALLKALQSKELVFTASGQKKTESETWQLGSLGQDITADAFACKFLRTKAPAVKQILGFNSAYQTALIKRLPHALEPDLWTIMTTDLERLAPEPLSLALKKLARSHTDTDIVPLVQPVLAKPYSPWLKTAICDALASFKTSESVGQLLLCVAKSDDSERVRGAAERALTRITMPTRSGQR